MNKTTQDLKIKIGAINQIQTRGKLEIIKKSRYMNRNYRHNISPTEYKRSKTVSKMLKIKWEK